MFKQQLEELKQAMIEDIAPLMDAYPSVRTCPVPGEDEGWADYNEFWAAPSGSYVDEEGVMQSTSIVHIFKNHKGLPRVCMVSRDSYEEIFFALEDLDIEELATVGDVMIRRIHEGPFVEVEENIQF